jgi:hypothetical protein
MLLASSAIIEDIRALQKSGLASLAFFYCDFRDDQKKDSVGYSHPYWSSLVNNPTPTPPFFPTFYENHGRGSQHASDSELQIVSKTC